MHLIGLDHLDIVVEDLQKSIEFYRKFGLSPEGTVDDGETVFLFNGDDDRPVRVELHQAKDGQKNRNEGTSINPAITPTRAARAGRVRYQGEPRAPWVRATDHARDPRGEP